MKNYPFAAFVLNENEYKKVKTFKHIQEAQIFLKFHFMNDTDVRTHDQIHFTKCQSEKSGTTTVSSVQLVGYIGKQ